MLVSLGLVASVCGDARLQRMLYLAHVNRAVNPRVHLLLVADNLAPSSSNIDPGAVFDPEPAAVAASIAPDPVLCKCPRGETMHLH